jgi:hypothetical protein
MPGLKLLAQPELDFAEKNCNATVAINCDIISHTFRIGKNDGQGNDALTPQPPANPGLSGR